ncbi:MAG: DUF5654 family protein [Candidatus Moranbacteria bacterium]|nr:DUF5654 family protein [Candidatus Moranbacteria bacterium]
MQKFKEELRNKSFSYITTAFGLVAGLAWNEAIKALIERFFPMSTGGMIAKFIYAIVITILLVFISVYILKIDEESSAKKDEGKKKK